MSLLATLATTGNLITGPFSAAALFEHFAPALEIDDIPLLPQQEDAWCYAACAQMIINFCNPQTPVEQCQIVSFVKFGDQDRTCCDEPGNEICLESGCAKGQIEDIFTRFQVNSRRTGPLDIGELANEFDGDMLTGRRGRPVEAVIDWAEGGGSHAVVLVQASGEMVFILDPLVDEDHVGWHDLSFLESGFGQGTWTDSWIGLEKA